MYTISSLYDEYLRRLDREFLVKAVIDGVDYGNTTIVNFTVENSLTLSEEFELGTAILSKLTISLRTQDNIPANAKIVPYVALSLNNMRWIDGHMTWDGATWPWTGNVTEWMPLGEFYVDRRERINDVWEYTCYDKLVWADVPYVSALTYPATMQAVWDEICTSLSYTYGASVVIDPAYQVQVGPVGYSKRQMLGYIAGANAASVLVGKDGVLKFKRFATADASVFDMAITDYVRVKQTNPSKTYTRIEATYDTEDDLSYVAGIGDDNHTLKLENPLITQGIADDLLTTLNGFTYLPLTMDARGFPQLEPGDVFTYERNDSRPWSETFETWDAMTLPWTGMTTYQSIILHQVYEFRGGLRMRIEAPSKSEQQSEFIVEGTLTGQINKLNKTAVRENRKYFGVTLTRTDGLIIEREDHASKVILNSDFQKFQAGGVDKLYFDPVAGKYKFVGDIVMEGGSISWTSVTGPAVSNVVGLGTRLTYIDGTGIYTGTLTAGQINAINGISLGANATIDWNFMNSDPAIATAQASANTANSLLADIANDSKITPVEKQATKKEWDIIVSELPDIDAQATTYSITTEKTTYDNAYTALSSYITPLLTDLTTTETIVGATFRTNFKTYYDARTAVLKAVTDKAKVLADAAKTVADNALPTASPKLTYIGSTGIYTGTLTASQINAITGISLGANATIDWTYVTAPSYGQVTGVKPPTDADNTVGAIGANRLTYIDGAGIYTGTLTAGQVNAVAISASSITTGTLSASYINTSGLASEKVYQAGTPSNYAVMGGTYGDMALYYNNTEFYRIYNDNQVATFRYKGIGYMYTSGYNTYPLNSWNFGSASVSGIPISGVTNLQSSLDGKALASDLSALTTRVQWLEDRAYVYGRHGTGVAPYPLTNYIYFDSKNVAAADSVRDDV